MSALFADDSGMAYQAACVAQNAAHMAYNVEEERLRLAQDSLRPSMILRPSLSIDSNKWCALYGANLQDGVCGFGDSPDEAYRDFDREWYTKLPLVPGKKE